MIQGNYKYLARGTRAAVDVNEVGKVRLTDALLRRILHVSLDALTHRRILPTPRTECIIQTKFKVRAAALKSSSLP